MHTELQHTFVVDTHFTNICYLKVRQCAKILKGNLLYRFIIHIYYSKYHACIKVYEENCSFPCATFGNFASKFSLLNNEGMFTSQAVIVKLSVK